MTKITHAAARTLLAKQRQYTSLLDKELIAVSDDMVFDKTDWVPLYFDRGNAVTSDCGQVTAYRAVTLKGEHLWMVFTPGKARGYHADCADPFEAIDRARNAWAHRRAVRQDWAAVEATARDLIWGRQRFSVTVADLEASPLCTMGCAGFRNAIGLGGVTRIPGWMAAVLMKVEPQMGFVIHAAMTRTRATRAADAAALVGLPA